MRKKDLLKKIVYLEKENKFFKNENVRLRNLCELKDAYFMEAISDGLRNGSSLAARHMADRRQYIKK